MGLDRCRTGALCPASSKVFDDPSISLVIQMNWFERLSFLSCSDLLAVLSLFETRLVKMKIIISDKFVIRDCCRTCVKDQ